jgi:hypothetical protein
VLAEKLNAPIVTSEKQGLRCSLQTEQQCQPCPAPQAQRELAASEAQLALDREAVRKEREGLERRAEALQQVGTGGLSAGRNHD